MLQKVIGFVFFFALLAGGAAAQGGTFEVKVGNTTVKVTLARVDDQSIVLYDGRIQPGATWERNDADGDGDNDDFTIRDGLGIGVLQNGATAAPGGTGAVLDGNAGNAPVGTYTRG